MHVVSGQSGSSRSAIESSDSRMRVNTSRTEGAIPFLTTMDMIPYSYATVALKRMPHGHKDVGSLELRLSSGVMLAPSESKAKEAADLRCHEVCPEEEGWFGHTSEVAEVTPEMLEAARRGQHD